MIVGCRCTLGSGGGGGGYVGASNWCEAVRSLVNRPAVGMWPEVEVGDKYSEDDEVVFDRTESADATMLES